MRRFDFNFSSFFEVIKQNRMVALTAIVFGFWTLPNDFQVEPTAPLDGDWTKAITYAFEKQLTFGTDVVFTYGPLGFLSTRYLHTLPYGYLLVFDLIIKALLIFVFFNILTSKNNMSISLLIFGIILFPFKYDEVFLLAWIFTFFVKECLSKPTHFNYSLAWLLAFTIFLVKVNVGLVCVFVYFFLTLYLLLVFKNKTIIYSALTHVFLSIFLLAMFHVHFASYVMGSLNIIDGYNDAMSCVYYPSWFPSLRAGMWIWMKILLVLVFILFVFLCLIAFYYAFKKKKKEQIFMNLLLLGLVYIMAKQSFVRMDVGHFELFFVYFPFLAALFFFINPVEVKFTLPFLFILISTETIFLVTHEQPSVVWSTKIQQVGHYFKTIFNPESAPQNASKNLKNIFGTETVDVIPNEIGLVMDNGLNYKPRPTLQSYKPYNTYLMALNEKGFMGDKGTQWVLIKSGAIDFRYPFWDDQQTKIRIQSDYTFKEKRVINSTATQSDTFLVLKKNGQPSKKIRTVEIQRFGGKLDQKIELVTSDRMLLLQANIEYNLLGKIMRFLFQPPKLSVQFEFDNGEVQTFKAVLPLVQSGVLVNYYIHSNSDLELYFTGQFDKLRKIKSITFYGNEKLFKNEFAIYVKQIERKFLL